MTTILTEQPCWRHLRSTKATASQSASALNPRYRLAENVRFATVVMAELGLCQVQRQILLADMMIGTDDATLEQAPEAFDVVGMHFTAHVLVRFVIYSSVAEGLMQFLIARAFIGGDQIDFLRYRLTNKSTHRLNRSVFDDAASGVALTRDRADHRDLIQRTAPALLLVPAAIAVQSSDVGFVHFHDSHEFAEIRIAHRGAQAHAHIPGRLIRAATDQPMDLRGADAFLAGQHQVQNLEPCAQRLFGFLENGPSLEREAIGRARLWPALQALPVPRTRLALVNRLVVTARAAHASGPALFKQIRPARRLIRKHSLEVGQRHLLRKNLVGHERRTAR